LQEGLLGLAVSNLDDEDRELGLSPSEGDGTIGFEISVVSVAAEVDR
jgi:hypothetical protein